LLYPRVQTFEEFGGFLVSSKDHFRRYITLKARIKGFVNCCHTTLTQVIGYPIATQGFTDKVSH